MLTNIPLGLVSPDRDEVARLGAMLVPARLIVHWHTHLGFENLDEPFAQPDGYSVLDAHPAEPIEMRNVEVNGHRWWASACIAGL